MRKGIVSLLLLFLACGPKAHFIEVGDQQYPRRQKGEPVQVYFGDDQPEKEYKIIGIVFIETDRPILSSETMDSEIIEKFQEEARKHGAHAIIDVGIASDTHTLPLRKTKHARAKAIVFTERDSTTIE